jgi:hypothetical protein
MAADEVDSDWKCVDCDAAYFGFGAAGIGNDRPGSYQGCSTAQKIDDATDRGSEKDQVGPADSTFVKAIFAGVDHSALDGEPGLRFGVKGSQTPLESRPAECERKRPANQPTPNDADM